MCDLSQFESWGKMPEAMSSIKGCTIASSIKEGRWLQGGKGAEDMRCCASLLLTWSW